jgi:hypothetical protein
VDESQIAREIGPDYRSRPDDLAVLTERDRGRAINNVIHCRNVMGVNEKSCPEHRLVAQSRFDPDDAAADAGDQIRQAHLSSGLGLLVRRPVRLFAGRRRTTASDGKPGSESEPNGPEGCPP